MLAGRDHCSETLLVWGPVQAKSCFHYLDSYLYWVLVADFHSSFFRLQLLLQHDTLEFNL